MNDLNSNDFNNVCRTCMSNCDIKFSRDNVISQIFFKLTDMQFETNDGLPQQICLKCYKKIYEIHEFSFHCKQTHFSLLKCLNSLQNARINAGQELLAEINKTLKTEDEAAIDEHEIEFLNVELLNPGSEYIIDEMKLKNEKNVLEDIIPETTNDDLSIPNTSNTENQSEEKINKTGILNDSFKKTYSSNNIAINKCKECGKTFMHAKNLKIHMRTHSGERPYKCDQCVKTFYKLGHLKRHMLTHTSERPFTCTQCLKSFKAMNTLKRHLLMHSGERLYKCLFCAKKYIQSSDLTVHMRTHTGERPFKCEQCSKVYARSSSLKKHMRRTHNNERTVKL